MSVQRLAAYAGLVIAGALASCGDDPATGRTTPTAVRPGDEPATVVDAFSGAEGETQFVGVAEQVCNAVTESAPAFPGADASASAVRRYAAAAGPAARRLDAAIGTLAQQRPASSVALAPLRERTAEVLAALTAAAGDERATSLVGERLQQLERVAVDGGFPACALR